MWHIVLQLLVFALGTNSASAACTEAIAPWSCKIQGDSLLVSFSAYVKSEEYIPEETHILYQRASLNARATIDRLFEGVRQYNTTSVAFLSDLCGIHYLDLSLQVWTASEFIATEQCMSRKSASVQVQARIKKEQFLPSP